MPLSRVVKLRPAVFVGAHAREWYLRGVYQAKVAA